MKSDLLAFLVRIDKKINWMLGGDINETLSSRAYRMDQKDQPVWGWTRAFIDWLFYWEENHCQRAYESYINGK